LLGGSIFSNITTVTRFPLFRRGSRDFDPKTANDRMNDHAAVLQAGSASGGTFQKDMHMKMTGRSSFATWNA
jgi:hypothetical protein